MTFQGYTEDTRAFFMALRYNNNREFFAAQPRLVPKARRARAQPGAGPGALRRAIEAHRPRQSRPAPHRVRWRASTATRAFPATNRPTATTCGSPSAARAEERGRDPSGSIVEVGAEGVSYGMGAYALGPRPCMNALRRQHAPRPRRSRRPCCAALDGRLCPATARPTRRLAVPGEPAGERSGPCTCAQGLLLGGHPALCPRPMRPRWRADIAERLFARLAPAVRLSAPPARLRKRTSTDRRPGARPPTAMPALRPRADQHLL